MNKAYKVRLYPTEKQKAQIDLTIHSCRFLYNKMLAERIEVYENLKDNKDALYAYKYKSPADYKKEFPFLKEASSWALNNEKRFLQSAYKNFFRRVKAEGGNVGFPKFKTRKTDKLSYTDYRCLGIPRVDGSRLTMNKIKEIKFRGLSDDFHGEIKSVTIEKTRSGKYYASILTEFDEPDKKERIGDGVVGVDLGLKTFISTSDGRSFTGIKTRLKEFDLKLRRQYKHLSRKVVNSSNWNKCRVKLNRIWDSRRFFINNFQWALANKLCRENQTVVLESLNVKGMLKNKRLSHAIHEVNWSSFVERLKQKAIEYGTEIVQVPRFFPSSKMCSRCGAIKQDLKLSDRIFRCECGFVQDRDLNAAVNIKNYFLYYTSPKNDEYSRRENIRPQDVSYDNRGGFYEAVIVLRS